MLALQRAVLFPRFAVRPLPDPTRGVPGLERIELTTDAGTVEAFFLPGDGADPDHPAPAVVFAHGNGELIDYWTRDMDGFRRMGVSVLLPEYRGYGRSAGVPSEVDITADCVRFHDRLVERADVDAERIVFHGRSLGGGVVCALARHREPAAMILQSTFTSVADVAARWLVPRGLIRDRFESLEVVRDLDVPVLVVHGTHDSVIPVAHGRRLHDAAKGSRLVLYDADHNDCPPDPEQYWRDVESFMRRAGMLRR